MISSSGLVPLYIASIGMSLVAIAIMVHRVTDGKPRRAFSVGMTGASIFVGGLVWYLALRSDLALATWL